MNPPGRRARWRRWALGAVLAIAVLLALAGALLVWQPAVLLRAGLWLAGHDEIAFDELRVGLNESELTGLAVGGPADHRVGRLRLDYRPSELLRGRIEQVSVEGVTLRGRIDQDGVRLEGLDAHGRGRRRAQPAAGCANPRAHLGPRRPARARDPARPPDRPVEAELRPERDRAVFVLEAERAELAAPAGQLRGGSADRGRGAAGPADACRRDHRVGPIAAAGRGVEPAGVASGLEGAGELAFVLERRQLHASLSGTRLQLEAIAPEWDAVAALLPAPWQVELARPVGISASFRGEEILVEGSGDLALAAAGPHLRPL